MRRDIRLPWLLGLGVAAVVVCNGCAGYKVGPSNGQLAGAQSIEVRPFLNQTAEPRLTAAITQSIRKTLQQDGTYRLNTRGDADVVVSGAIIEYERSGASYRPDDVITPRDYFIRLKARVHAVQRSTGRVLLDREVSGRTTVRVDNDQVSAERQAIPLLADDLAWHATSLLVDGEF